MLDDIVCMHLVNDRHGIFEIPSFIFAYDAMPPELPPTETF